MESSISQPFILLLEDLQTFKYYAKGFELEVLVALFLRTRFPYVRLAIISG